MQALETAGTLFRRLGDRTASGLNTLVPALAASLGSTNDKVRQEAVMATGSLVAAVDPALLVQVSRRGRQGLVGRWVGGLVGWGEGREGDREAAGRRKTRAS